MILRTATLSLVTLLAIITGTAACDQADPVITPCSDIPTNGCPLLSDGSDPCGDTTCAAAYECDNGTWVLDYACPAFVADAGTDAAPSPVQDGSAAVPCYDAAAINLPPGASASGTVACEDLQSPDCPLSEVLACTPGSVDPCFGCESLFYCLNGEWNFWGQCTEDGGVQETN